MMLSYFFWDPSRAIFNYPLPLIGRPILWYGFFFALGFLLGYAILLYLLKGYFREGKAKDPERQAKLLAERITLYVILGTIVGARLGDILFYQDLSAYFYDPLEMFKVWEGGLSSHGGALGILIALYILSKRKGSPFSWLQLIDFLVVPAALAGALIRVGNFFNQEILGTVTNVPWAVVFGHPADGSPPFPRHPVQLYEAFFYLALFLVLLFIWRSSRFWKQSGKISALFLLLVFGFRFFIEFFKTEQSAYLSSHSVLTMGQFLSLPFFCLGLYLLLKR